MQNNDRQQITSPIIINNPMYITNSEFLPLREREIESLLSIGNGYAGTRNSIEEHYINCEEATFISGIYEPIINTDYNALINVADWSRIQVYVDNVMSDMLDERFLEHVRYIDLNNGLCVRNWRNVDHVGRITSITIKKFISLENKNIAYKTLLIKPENYSGNIKVTSGIDATHIDFDYIMPLATQNDSNISSLFLTNKTKKTISITQKSQFLHNNQELGEKSDFYTYSKDNQDKYNFEQWEWNAEVDHSYSINSVISIFTGLDSEKLVEAGKNLLLSSNIYEQVLNNHCKKFKSRWKDSEISISTDDKAQTWINFALYHLIIAGEFSGKTTSIPARGLSGEAYQGHIFWDTEIFLLPFYIFTCPEIARNLLLYRYNTLATVRENTKKEGLAGADYPWESTDSGEEMTPPQVILPNGESIPIYSGAFEHHITPDIAYAVWQYWTATDDSDFLTDYGAEILFETARYCMSLFKKGDDDLYHIYSVIGPDEYHEKVDDNIYTNIMCQFNLEIAIMAAEIISKINRQKYENLKNRINLIDDEIAEWEKVKNSVYTGYDPETKLFEQFKGYFKLKYVDLKEYEPRTAPMDVLLGRDETEKTQIIKQADVVMFLFLLAEKFSIDTIEANYDFYEPMTGHGSSLSPGIHSVVAARLGKITKAYDYFTQNAEIDLNDIMGNASGGVHMAALGGSWMTIVMGFAGMYQSSHGLVFNPNLPDNWDKLQFSICWKNCKITVQILKTQININISGNNKVNISAGFDNWKELDPNKAYTAVKDEKWNWQ